MSAESFGPEFIERLLAGDRDAGRLFVNRFGPRLRAKIRARSPWIRESDLQDVVQETYARVLTALREDKLRLPDRLAGFLSGVCSNVLHEQSNQPRYVDIDPLVATFVTLEDPESISARRETVAAARQIVDALPARDRQLFELVLADEVDRREMSLRLQVSEANLRLLIFRLKKLLQQRLGVRNCEESHRPDM